MELAIYILGYGLLTVSVLWIVFWVLSDMVKDDAAAIRKRMRRR